ncbi:hypothetical protein ACPA9J_28975 [Pseudomonas aeruginosa]
MAVAPPAGDRGGRPARSPPSATNPAGSTTSCAAVPVVRRPVSSRFYLSLEDNLMRIFASDRVKNFMKALGMQSGEADRAPHGDQRHREGPAQGSKGATSTSASNCWNSMT